MDSERRITDQEEYNRRYMILSAFLWYGWHVEFSARTIDSAPSMRSDDEPIESTDYSLFIKPLAAYEEKDLRMELVSPEEKALNIAIEGGDNAAGFFSEKERSDPETAQKLESRRAELEAKLLEVTSQLQDPK